ncbi:phage late control D family protein [Brevundimonas bacteroides]|uniref:phage late control D family protein n=1 Tax=Brevundimonas bacteroides TaxID=74311 RepID=UPI000690601F|nr:contractile injection system protein, VgrG/Pvc8 family [Brevundimonas bacteroides]
MARDASAAAALLARFRVDVNGRDISPALAPVLQSLRVRDAAGQSSDTAEIELDDRAGSIVLPRPRARIEIRLSDARGLSLAFVGTVDETRSRGDRSGGRILTVSAKGADVLGRAKQIQERHFDDVTIEQALRQAGQSAGISDVRVDPELSQIQRPYLAMEGESFLAFGQRLGREVGGTFKVIGDRALLIRRNAGTAVSGRQLDVTIAEYGRNLLSWDIAPFIGRPRHTRARSRHYDPDSATVREQTAPIAEDTADADLVVRYPAADEGASRDQANASAAEAERSSGAGTVSIDADVSAKPEGICRVIGARPGIDGDYRIDAVEHSIDRSGGLTTSIELGQPQGSAGRDERQGSSPTT